MPERLKVAVVDDDDGMRNALYRLLRNAGLDVEMHASAQAFLDQLRPEQLGCLLLDVRMPGMDGLALQQILIERSVQVPLIFLTGQADVAMAVAAMRDGALDFVEKPFDNEDLLRRVQRALAVGEEQRRAEQELAQIRVCRERLTPRETEVMELMVAGKLSKQIADTLDVSPRTVEIHRARVMEKMEAGSLADLVRMVLATR